MIQSCSFCLEPSVIHCMNRSVAHKHSEQEERSHKIIEALISNEDSSQCVSYKQAVVESDVRQYMNYYMCGKELTCQNLELLEYYKYRIFVPVFVRSAVSERAISYYYEKLKLYYNNIKRHLNITVQRSSTTLLNTEQSQSGSLICKEHLLKDLKLPNGQEKQTKQKQSISSYKSQSKALEQLVSYLKLNSHFQNVKTLKTEDCFYEQSIFQATHKKTPTKAEIEETTARKGLKAKLFKKILDRAENKNSLRLYETYKDKQRPKSRSIKLVKLRQDEQIKGKAKQTKISLQKYPQLKAKGTSSTKTLPVRNNSLNRITQNHYSSPTKHKTGTTQKYAATAIVSKNIRSKSIQNIKVKNFEDTKKSRGCLLTTQVIKFQATPIKSSPVSPSAKKTPRPEIKVGQNDNMITIRKKRLQALKEKTGRK